MPIYEFACPKCRKIFSFLSKRVNPERLPVCPKCGNKKLKKEVSRFATTKGLKESADRSAGQADGPQLPDMEDPRLERAMLEMERDMAHLDENNPRHMAHLMRKMKDLMPSGAVPKEMEAAIKRLEAGEDPEQIEADMGDVFDQITGGSMDSKNPAPYSKDAGLYDY